MTTGKVITGTLHRTQRGHGRAFVAEPAPVIAPVCRPARMAIMLALAHKIAAAIANGQLRDQADAARRLDITRARVTQLLALLLLAPDLQERVLFLEAIDGIEPVTERALRLVTHTRSWEEQRATYHALIPASPGTPPPDAH
ncbi:MAG TPA: hypothetical protein VHN14_31035 [Kofleriaceae bacterium]|jgi:hypothetical protein|nr:hypothetical protein [Kofleriaceae bacterium]